MSRNSLSGRNTYVDALRGIAMLLVVLGHTMTGCTEGAQQSLLYQVVWSLQIPMFILISGYVTRYGSEIKEFKGVIKFARKRTIAYLWPWVVWTVFVCGIIFGNKLFLNPSYILWHMDSGYWFLFSIWTISMIFGISQFLSSVIAKNNTGTVKVIYIGVVYLLGMFLLTGLGFAFGLSFLGIKLILYYMPFYFLGYLYGKLQDQLFKFKSIDNWIELIVAISFIVWIGIITRFNLYDISDNGLGVAIRAVASLFGCIAVFGLLKSVLNFTEKRLGGTWGSDTSSQSCNNYMCNLCNYYSDKSEQIPKNNNIWKNVIVFFCGFSTWIGNYSLEIYVLHGFFLNLLRFNKGIAFSSAEGIMLAFSNYLLTVFITACVVAVIHSNRILRKWLFAK